MEQSVPLALTNSEIAELLALQAEKLDGTVQRAFRRASRRAFLWPESATDLLEQGRTLIELSGVGSYLERVIRCWIEGPPAVPVVPEIRRDFLTVPEARSILQSKRVLVTKLKGDLQMHTSWSDGTGSVLEMAEAAQQLGYEYIAITDHSKGLAIAGGIDEKQLRSQQREIELVNDELRDRGVKLRVLRSIELNLSPQGEGDMDAQALGELDIVLGSFHSALRRKQDQTKRYLAALRNPTIQILGHPRGRIYNYRLGLTADWPRVFGVAAQLNKAVEIDSYPDRQDLNVSLLRLARKAGCRVSIGTDAHGPSQLAFIELGLAAAAMAGIKRERIINFMGKSELIAWVGSVRNAE